MDAATPDAGGWTWYRVLAGLYFLFWTGIGTAAAFQGLRWLRLKRRVEDTPTALVRSMPMGSVELRGRALRDPPLLAPISRVPSAFWQVEVEEYQRDGDGGACWVRRLCEASDEAFRLDDGTGSVCVLPAGAEFRGSVCGTWDVDSSAPPAARAFIESHSISTSLIGGGPLRVRESRIGNGAIAYVLGVAQERLDPRRRRVARVNEDLRALRDDPAAMRALDHDGDGRISSAEWDAARERVVRDVEAGGDEDRVVVARGRLGEPFLLSDRSERALDANLQWKALVAMVLGLLVVGAMVYGLWEVG